MKIIYIVLLTIIAQSYFLKDYHFKQKIQIDRLNELYDESHNLSGVRIAQRQAFGNWLLPLNYLLPYHQSLILPISNGKIKQIGLGQDDDHENRGLGARTSYWVEHVGKQYEGLDAYEFSIPVEAWGEYKEVFGTWPSNINISLLESLTQIGSSEGDITFGEVFFDQYFQMPNIKSCRSEIMRVIRTCSQN